MVGISLEKQKSNSSQRFKASSQVGISKIKTSQNKRLC